MGEINRSLNELLWQCPEDQGSDFARAWEQYIDSIKAQSIMGDASTRKDEGCTGTTGSANTASVVTASPVISSEIPVNEQYVVIKVGPHRKMLRNSMDDTYTLKVERRGDTAAFTIMRQYPEGPFYKNPETFCFAANCETHLPATEPVSGSLGKRVMYDDGTPSREYEEQPVGISPLDQILRNEGECWPRTLREHINAISRNNVMVSARDVWRILDALIPLATRERVSRGD